MSATGRIPFRRLFHADWSTAAKKRWVACAAWNNAGWEISPPRLVGDTRAFVDELFTASSPVLVGFDFPIGVPVAYGRLTGLADFLTALNKFGQGEWAEFFVVADTHQQISRTRPFYPRVSRAGSKPEHLLHGLGIDSIDALRRQCERTSPSRKAACPLFWTLGGNQVGKAAISGWQEVIAPARRRGARLWPFDGSLAELSMSGAPVVAETYPAEAYGHVGVAFSAKMSKRRQADRRAAMLGLFNWARQRGATFAEQLTTRVNDGFGPRSDGEDAFDALIGLLGMIEVVDGRRLERPSHRNSWEDWEGWILGQAESGGRGHKFVYEQGDLVEVKPKNASPPRPRT
ncbi:MAG TPA: hypothetical protein VJO12_14350 [Stellaceae bacterium]|nr:hypothetical protein [Stellaceae bacterium]